MSSSANSSEIFKRVIDPRLGSLSQATADYFSTLDFNAEDHARYDILSGKASEGTLTPDEAAELDNYLHVDSLISIMRLKAERTHQMSSAS